MAAAGAPVRAIQEWLGHADLRTTLIYADYALDPNQGALYAERAFGELGGPTTTPATGSEVARVEEAQVPDDQAGYQTARGRGRG
jgi:hypothetical protein